MGHEHQGWSYGLCEGYKRFMARIVVATSSTAGLDTIFDADLIGQALSRRGHEVLYIAHDIAAMQAASTTRLPILQAPMSGLRFSATDLHEQSDLAVQLIQAGFAETETALAVARSWAALLNSLQPDCLVALASPAAWLVGPQITTTFALGRARSLPAIGKRTAEDAPDFLLKNANIALSELGANTLEDFPGLLRRCQQWHFGLDVLDPHAALRTAPGLGVLATPPEGFLPPVEKKLSLFLDADYPGIESVVLSLAALADLRLVVFIRRASVAMQRFIDGLPHTRFVRNLSDALLEAKDAAATAHHGLAGIAEHGLLNGRPQLVLPWTNLQRAVLEDLKKLGVAWWKEPNRSAAEISDTLRGVSTNEALISAAKSSQEAIIKSGVDDARIPLVAAIEAAIALRSRPTEGPEEKRRSRKPDVGQGIAASRLPSAAEPVPALAMAGSVPISAATESKVFCTMPFHHTCIGNEGTARICCMALGDVMENGKPMSLYTKSADEIWNSDYMREVRRKILADEPLAECRQCYEHEAATSTSYRKTTGIEPLLDQSMDIEAIRRDAIANDYRVKHMPDFIKLELGNLCNLRCRMCWGGNSSEIERDPVHSRWRGGVDPLHAIWQGESAVIGPDSKIGILRQGLHSLEGVSGAYFAWTDGAAHLDVPLGSVNSPNKLIVDFAQVPQFSRSGFIRVNGKPGEPVSVGPQGATVTVAIDPAHVGPSLAIDIESDRHWNEQSRRWEGLPISHIRLQRQLAANAPDHPTVLNSRLEKPGVWYKNNELMFRELLADVQTLKRLYITGGEPFLEPRFAEIIDFLIKSDVAKNMVMELTTNATVVDEVLLDKLTQFKSVMLTISIDGVGAVQEYIRFPVRWRTISRNMPALLRPKFSVIAVPVVQAYNMLDLANICRFASESGIGVSLMNNLSEPSYLSASIMPRAAHQLAADRLREVVDGLDDYVRGQVQSLISHFSSFDQPLNIDALRTFNQFTNDLDASRGQNFSASLPDLYALIEEAGFRWSNEMVHSDAGKRRAARDRIHAWV